MKAEDIQAGLITPVEGGLVTPSGLTSIPAGLETPEMIQLRKKKIEEAMEQGGDTPALYTVLPEKTSTVGVAVMGSSHVYDLSAAVPGATKKAGGGSGTEGVEVALDPSELDLDTAAMTARYEEQLKESKLQKEDLSDMVAEHAAKQKKRKRAATDSSSSKAKKLKEFKF
jgi:splicing factor 3B subunit 2